MMHPIALAACLMLALVPALGAQRVEPPQRQDGAPSDSAWQAAKRTTWRHEVAHYGKWLTAGSVVAFTVLAANEHEASEREWDALLAICRSAEDACARGDDGRYLRADAEQRYQASRAYDGRAMRRLLVAQASLLVTAALFIVDLRPGDGPANIPYSPAEVTAGPLRDGTWVGVRIVF